MSRRHRRWQADIALHRLTPEAPSGSARALTGPAKARLFRRFARESHGKIHDAARRRRAAADDQCRHRHDHPQAVPEDHQAHRARARRCSTRCATTPDGSEKPDFVLNKPAYRKAQILVAGDEFRLRLEPRARALGAARFRHPLRHRAELRRHLLQQLLQERHPADHAAAGRSSTS